MNKGMKKHLNMPVRVEGEDAIALSAKVREDRVGDGDIPDENSSGSHLGDVIDGGYIEVQNRKKIKLEQPVLASAMETDGCKCKKECGGKTVREAGLGGDIGWDQIRQT